MMATRLLFDLGGTVTSNGTATVGGGAGQQQPASSWSLAIITASLASGAGSWTIELVRSQGGTGSLVGATYGDTVQSGPYLLAPGELLQASVAGATAGTGIVGSVYGTSGLDPSNLPAVSAVPSQAESVNATIGGPVPVSNGGLVAALSQIAFAASYPITVPGGPNSVYVGSVSGTPHYDLPPAATSLVLFVNPAASGAFAVRLIFYDASGNELVTMYRESGVSGGTNPLLWTLPIIGSGFRVDSYYKGSATGNKITIYASSAVLNDTWLDTTILDSGGSPNAESIVLYKNQTTAAGNNTFPALTYRGDATVSLFASTAATVGVNSLSYPGVITETVQDFLSVPANGTGTAKIWLPGSNNQFVVNTPAASVIVFSVAANHPLFA